MEWKETPRSLSGVNILGSGSGENSKLKGIWIWGSKNIFDYGTNTALLIYILSHNPKQKHSDHGRPQLLA